MTWYKELFGFYTWLLCPLTADRHSRTQKASFQSWTRFLCKISSFWGVKRFKQFRLLPVQMFLHINRSKYFRRWYSKTLRCFKRRSDSFIFYKIFANSIKTFPWSTIYSQGIFGTSSNYAFKWSDEANTSLLCFLDKNWQTICQLWLIRNLLLVFLKHEMIKPVKRIT